MADKKQVTIEDCDKDLLKKIIKHPLLVKEMIRRSMGMLNYLCHDCQQKARAGKMDFCNKCKDQPIVQRYFDWLKNLKI